MTATVAAITRAEFADYVATHRRHLLWAAYRITGDHHDAEDLLQSALASVLPQWGGIRDPRAANAYIRRTMANEYAGWFRARWRSVEQLTDSPPERTRPDGQVHVLPPSGRGELWRLVKDLPFGQRSVIVLRYYEELSVAETAAVLGCCIGTVKCNASRALATLRRRLGELPEFDLAS